MILVPAHSSWMAEVPGDRAQQDHRAGLTGGRHDIPPAAVGAAASMPSVR